MVVSPNGELLEEAKMKLVTKVDVPRTIESPRTELRIHKLVNGKHQFNCWHCRGWYPQGTLKQMQFLMDNHLDTPRHQQHVTTWKKVMEEKRTGKGEICLPFFSFGGN